MLHIASSRDDKQIWYSKKELNKAFRMLGTMSWFAPSTDFAHRFMAQKEVASKLWHCASVPFKANFAGKYRGRRREGGIAGQQRSRLPGRQARKALFTAQAGSLHWLVALALKIFPGPSIEVVRFLMNHD